MPDVNTIPFKQADPNGHYRSKQLPNDSGDFMQMLGLPAFAGDVVGPGGATVNQVAVFENATGKKIRAAVETGLAKLSGGVLTAVTAPVGEVVGTTDPQVLTNKTLTNPTITGLTGLTKNDVGLGNVDNTSDANKPVSGPQQAALNLKQDLAAKATANGYASLDAAAKVPLSQIPDSVVGGQQYQGTWNAATNTPAIPTAVLGNKGWYYSVNVAGTTNINGISSWAVGDQIISNGSVWQKIANVSAVNSVNGYTGVVVLGKADVGLGNVDNTSDAAKPVSTATATQLALKEDKTNKGAANGYAGLDATGKVPAANVPADLVTSVAGKQGVVTLVKGDVGLGNVDNTSDVTYSASTATLTNKTINGANNTLTVRLANDVTGNLPVTNLNAGTGANSGSFWRGDGQWAPPAGGGDVVGPAGGVVDGELVAYNATTGKVIKGSGGKLVANLVSGPASATSGRIASYGDATGKLIADGGKLASDLVTGPASSVDGEAVLFSGTSGKLLKSTTKLIVGDTTLTGYAAGTVVIPTLATSSDVVIASPGAFDDHFEGSTLNAKWTLTSAAAGGGVTTAVVAGSCVSLNCQSNTSDGVKSLSYIVQNLPNANNFIVSFKLNYQLYGHTVVGSVGNIEVDINSITPSVNGLKVRLARQYIASVGGVEQFSFNTGLGLATTYATFYGDIAPYHRFIWNRTPLTIEWQTSFDGLTWMSMKYGLIASAQSGFNGTTLLPQQFGISVTAVNFAQGMASVDWVKFVNF